jgi:hypothetical protein
MSHCRLHKQPSNFHLMHAPKADDLTAICELKVDVGASASHKPVGLHGLSLEQLLVFQLTSYNLRS